ncbi:hypothetical protein [Brevibacillus sp. 179-C9.3 HS]|uniref:hypothetical protein n=1 Tax=unclassified Brevibacillus TaxID=2684853 RepID=UPI0039A2F0B5
MANADIETKYIERRKLISVIPHANATWVDQYNTLLDDLKNGKYRNHESLHVYGSNIKHNALIQSLVKIALDEVMNSDEKITLRTSGLPTELMRFLNSQIGQDMVMNMLLNWYQNGMGMGALPPSSNVLPRTDNFVEQPISNEKTVTNYIAAEEMAVTSISFPQTQSVDTVVQNHEVHAEVKSESKETETLKPVPLSRAQKLKERAKVKLN